MSKVVRWCKVLKSDVASIAKFFEILESTLKTTQNSFWFRGHANIKWELCPSALRHNKSELRNKALKIMQEEFKRFSYKKIPNPPIISDDLSWAGLAQHYGLPTRFLDWTQNPVIALYFCVSSKENEDGAVYVVNPSDINLKAKKERRIFDIDKDRKIIEKYLLLDSESSSRGKIPTIAINPIYNTDRILLQRGAFTLHGNKKFSLDSGQASSLLCLKIKSNNKDQLRQELSRIGIDRMSIFPEIEHVSKYLKRKHLSEV